MDSRRSLLTASLLSGLLGPLGCSKGGGAARPSGLPLPSAGAATETILRIGDRLPEIEAVDLDGNAVTLGEDRLGGGHTLLVFWSTWCGFCMKELPHEVELARKYERRGLRVIGVNADDTPAIAKAAAEENGVPWLDLFEGPERPISKKLGIRQWPTLLLFDPDGKLLCATQHLRSVFIRTMPDGSPLPTSGLDWTLEEILSEKAEASGRSGNAADGSARTP